MKNPDEDVILKMYILEFKIETIYFIFLLFYF